MVIMEEAKVMDDHPHLSPFANPYSPETIDIAIYNDGVPSMMLTSEADIYDVLRGIEDPLQSFPLDARDAAELDEADEFVEAMALLAFMEEREESCRSHFTHLKKRWEARRARGLVGRPRPPKHMIDPVQHMVHTASPHNQDVKALVRSLMQERRMLATEKQRAREMKRGNDALRLPRKMQVLHQTRRAYIQQPRKQY